MTTLHQAQAALQALVSTALAGLVVGNKQTISLGGTVTGGDMVSITMTSPGIAGSPVTASYTAKAADALLNIGAGLARAMNAIPAVRAAGIIAVAGGAAPNVFAQYPAGLAVTWSAAVSGGQTETVGLSTLVQTPTVGIGWPPLSALQEVSRGAALVTVYDRRVGRNVMRWSPYSYNQVVIPATLTTAVAPDSGAIAPMGTGTVTLGGVPTLNDAVSCIIRNPTIVQDGLDQVDLGQTGAQVVSATTGQSADDVAAALVLAVNGDATLSQWVLASATGSVVTLQNLTGATLVVQSYAGNGGSQTTELIRKERQFQVTSWTRTELLREAICNPIDQALATAMATFSGVTDSNGNPIRVTQVNDYDLEDDTLEDTYRHDFLVTLEYAVTTTDQLYAILAPVVDYAVTAD